MRIEGGTLHLTKEEADQARQGTLNVPGQVNARWQGQSFEFEFESQGRKYSIQELQRASQNPQIEQTGSSGNPGSGSGSGASSKR
jgi:hypothetical protein